MNSLLDDRKTYKKLTKDPTPAIEWKIYALLLQLKKKGAITDDQYSRLGHQQAGSHFCTVSLRFTSPQSPFAPIGSFVHSPTYQLLKYLYPVLLTWQLTLACA